MSDLLQKASREEIAALQLPRLQQTLRHAYENVAFYRDSFDRHGVHPDDCRTLGDIGRFPFTTKADLRDNYPYGMFAVPRAQVARIHASSGTTGRPTVVGYTTGDLDRWADLMARSIHAAGGRPGMTVHVAYGYGLFTGGLGAHYGAERLGCTVVPVSGGMTARQVQLIVDFEPEIIMVTPSYFLAIVDEMERQHVDPRSTSLRIGIFGAEPWTEVMRSEIEERCAMDAVDIYGLSEVMGPGVAQECLETKDGLHVWEDHFLPEIINAAGDAQPEGSPGELVFTSLTKQALPVIRYRTRDLTTLLPGTRWPGMRRIMRVTGRSDDMMIVRGVNIFPTQVEELLLGIPALSPHFVCVLTRPTRMDELTVRAERRQGVTARESEAARDELVRRAKDALGVTITVDVGDPGSIERSQGKAQRVDDRR